MLTSFYYLRYISLTCCRKQFRPAFGKLDVLSSIFPNVPIVALTATATKSKQEKIINSIGLQLPFIVEVNPDRENIYFESRPRPAAREERVNILHPYVKELKAKRLLMPLTIFYGDLECCAESFLYFSSELGNMQYEPFDADQVAKNRLFTQYHAQYPKHQQERIMDELVSNKCKHRVFFVTVAFGIGIDCPNIRRVIHLGVPYTMEEYFQEAGRAGRDGLPAEATMYYNAYDISKAKHGLQDTMINFAKSTECKRDIILQYFGYRAPKRKDGGHNCCDHHRNICKCELCKEAVSKPQTLHECDADSELSAATTIQIAISQEHRDLIRKNLISYREGLGSSRSCVGNISLSTGFSLQLIDKVMENIENLHSVDAILSSLPVFSEENARVIFEIIQGVLAKLQV